MVGEDSTEVENVHTRLVVAYQYGGAGSVKVVFTLNDEFDADEGRDETPEGTCHITVDVESLRRNKRKDKRDDDAPTEQIPDRQCR